MARSNSAEYDRKYYRTHKKKLRKKHLENYYANQTYYRLSNLRRYYLRRGNKARAAELQKQMRLMLVGSQRRTRNKPALKRSRKFSQIEPRDPVPTVSFESASAGDAEVATDSDREAQIRSETAEISDLQEYIPVMSDKERQRIRKAMYGDDDA